LQSRFSSSGAFVFNDYNNNYSNSNVGSQLLPSYSRNPDLGNIPEDYLLKPLALVGKLKKTEKRHDMKRYGQLFEQIASLENLKLADQRARKGKAKQFGVISHDKNREKNLNQIHQMLINQTFRTSTYSTFKIYEPKERDVYRLPYMPDRIIQHAVMNVMEPIWVSTFTADTYSCIKNRGIHAAATKLKEALKDVSGTQYCLKLDIKKFYPNVDHAILKQIIRRKIKDVKLLWLLDDIIDSAAGVPIGNYLSQYFANLYLTGFDHWIKEQKKVRYYFRYADDLVLLHNSKEYLHSLLADINLYLNENLRLEVKGNYQVFPVAKRGIDFLGYPFYHTHTLLRKSIKKSIFKMLAYNPNSQSLAAYLGWLKHCDSKHLQKEIMKRFNELNIEKPKGKFKGNKINIQMLINCEIQVNDFRIKPSKIRGKCLTLDVDYKGLNYVIFTGSHSLLETIELVPKEEFPFLTTITQGDFKRLEFN